MKPKILTVKEFDRIKKEKLGERCFTLFEEFIEDNSGDDTEERLSDFLRISSFKGVKVITPQNYVGVINIDNKFQIEILPKIGIDDDNELRNIFLKMLSSLKEFKGKSFKNAQLNDSNLPIYEIFIKMYLNEVQELLKKGLKSDYVTLEGNIPYFRGKFLVNQHIKYNSVRKDRFYMAYDEFHNNRPENRLIKSTLLKLNKISINGKNQLLAKRLLAEFEMVNHSINFDKDFSLVKEDRNTRSYQNLMYWSKIFLKNKSFSTFKGTTNVSAMLFPMEKIFESYISKQLKNISANYSGYKIETQKQTQYLFDEPRKFRLKPDIYISMNSKPYKVLDIKWKRLNTDFKNNYGISQSDMYQMYAYAYKYNVEDIVLIYPKQKGLEFEKLPLYIQNSEKNNHLKRVAVQVFLYDLTKEKSSLDDIKDIIFVKRDN